MFIPQQWHTNTQSFSLKVFKHSFKTTINHPFGHGLYMFILPIHLWSVGGWFMALFYLHRRSNPWCSLWYAKKWSGSSAPVPGFKFCWQRSELLTRKANKCQQQLPAPPRAQSRPVNPAAGMLKNRHWKPIRISGCNIHEDALFGC